MNTKQALCALVSALVLPVLGGTEGAEITFWAIPGPKIVSSISGDTDILDKTKSGANAPAFLEEVVKWLDGESHDNDPGSRTAVIPVPPGESIDVRTMMLTSNYTDPFGLWKGEIEGNTGSYGNGVKFGVRVVLPEGHTTTGATFNAAFRIDSSFSEPAWNQNPIDGLLPNPTRRWFTSLGSDGKIGGGDDVTTENPDASIVAADYCGVQIALNLVRNSGDDPHARLESLPRAMQNLGVTFTSSISFQTEQGLEVSGSETWETYYLVIPDICIVLEDKTPRVIATPTRSWLSYQLEISTDGIVWTDFGPEFTGNGGDISILMDGGPPTALVRWRVMP